jgi:hypothetical protein
VGRSVLERRQANAVQPVASLGAGIRAAVPAEAWTCSDVVQHSFPRDYRVLLKTTPTPGAMPDTDRPATETVPVDGRSKPATNAKVVDFPHPVGPTTALNLPGCTARVKSRSAA